MELKTSELFRNIKTLPPKDSKEEEQLAQWEVQKCKEGIHINGIYIPGWLYWHLNHWWIRIDQKDNVGNIVRIESLPHLRDNEWIISEALEKARVAQKGLMIVGARQISKSETEASYTGYTATLFKGTQNVIVGGSDADLDLLKDKIGFGIRRGWNGIMIPRLDKDWRKSMVRLGFKERGTNEDDIWSYIVIRNVADGKNTEGPAGVTAKSFISDEVAKYAFASAFEASKPAFVSEFGWRCVPILTATGGNADKFADAERYFYHPDANNLIGFDDPKTGKRTGLFMSGLFRQDCKYLTNLGDYLIETGALPAGSNISELSKMEMRVSDNVKALQKISADRKQKALDPDQSEYRKQIMYYPLDIDECFLTNSQNFFNTEIAKQQKDKLSDEYPGLKIGMYVDLVEKEGKIMHEKSHKLPVSSFPRKHEENTNCPIVIIEHPIPDPPYGLYVAGIDPYRFEKALSSDSLGAIYIYKRSYDALSDKFQDMFVAWYVARPDSKDEWNKNVKLLIKYYNAVALCENDEMSFIDYMMREGEGHRLMDTPQWIKDYNPTAGANVRLKGVSASPKNIDLFNTNYKQYTEEVFASVPIPGTTETRKILGVSKIMDPMLLEEVIKWNKDGNFDRIRAASIAITCAKKMDVEHITPMVSDEPYVSKKPKGPKPLFKPMGRTYQYTDSRTQLQRLLK